MALRIVVRARNKTKERQTVPYGSTKELPAAVKALPEQAQKIYLAAFNSASKQYDSEDKAHAVAWAAVKNKYKKNDQGEWVAKDSISDNYIFDEMISMDDAAAVRITSDGYLIAAPRIARTGIQIYKGFEVGRPDVDTVRVYRPEDQVFAKDAMGSLAFRPITLDHPGEPVTAENWRKFAVGLASGEIARDGEFVRIPMALMDAEAIREYRNGKAQLSVGYAADLKWGEGTTPKGEVYDAMQTSIRGNHIAMVRAARGGPQLRIGDKHKERNMTERTITLDGVSVTVDDRDAQIIERTIAQLNTQLADANGKLRASETKVGEITTQLADAQKAVQTKDGEIVVLKKQVEDAKSPDKLNQAVRERSEVVDRARTVLGDALVIDGRTNEQIRRAVVEKGLGAETAKAMGDDAIAGAFYALTKDGTADGSTRRDAVSDMAGGFGRPGNGYGTRIQDEAGKAHKEYVDSVSNAWRPKKPGAAA
jgi:cation transport regulator ChaB